MKRPAHRVHHVRHLNPGTFVLRFDRHDFQFEPGQYVDLGIPGSIARREYSLYSGAWDDFLEVQMEFSPSRFVSCLSRGQGGDYEGRVTGYLRNHPVDPDRRCYPCGNSDMISEAFAILRDQGVPWQHLFAEVYF